MYHRVKRVSEQKDTKQMSLFTTVLKTCMSYGSGSVKNTVEMGSELVMQSF